MICKRYVSQHIPLSAERLFITLQITSRIVPKSTETIDIENDRIYRLKVVLEEGNKKGKWLAEQLGKNEATVSR